MAIGFIIHVFIGTMIHSTWKCWNRAILLWFAGLHCVICCDHEKKRKFLLEDSILRPTFAFQDGVRLPPCPYKPRLSPHEARAKTQVGRPNYYSDWSVYAQAVNSNFSTLSSSWTVPPAPLSHGPADLSSVYIFNGTFN